MTLKLQNSERKKVRDCQGRNSQHPLFLTDPLKEATGGSLPFPLRPPPVNQPKDDYNCWSIQLGWKHPT